VTSALLAGIRVVTTALNLPGPAACARLRDLGAVVTKIEPPSGDPMEAFNSSWYRRLHGGIEVRRLDLKQDAGREALAALLEATDILVTAQRASALARLGLDAPSLAQRFPRLCHVAITGHAPPRDEVLPAVTLGAHRLLAALDAAGRSGVLGRRLLRPCGLGGLIRLGGFRGLVARGLGGGLGGLLLIVFLGGHWGADNMRSGGRNQAGPARRVIAAEPRPGNADTGEQ